MSCNFQQIMLKTYFLAKLVWLVSGYLGSYTSNDMVYSTKQIHIHIHISTRHTSNSIRACRLRCIIITSLLCKPKWNTELLSKCRCVWRERIKQSYNIYQNKMILTLSIHKSALLLDFLDQGYKFYLLVLCWRTWPLKDLKQSCEASPHNLQLHYFLLPKFQLSSFKKHFSTDWLQFHSKQLWLNYYASKCWNLPNNPRNPRCLGTGTLQPWNSETSWQCQLYLYKLFNIMYEFGCYLFNRNMICRW